jgi:hypothetical protein
MGRFYNLVNLSLIKFVETEGLALKVHTCLSSGWVPTNE